MVVLASGDQTAHVVLMHMRYDHRVDLVELQAKRTERLRQFAGLPDRARCTGIDQDAALAIIDEILVEEEPHPTRPGGELSGCGLLHLGRGASRKIVEGHIGIPVCQCRHREATDADLRQRRNADRRFGGILRGGRGRCATDRF